MKGRIALFIFALLLTIVLIDTQQTYSQVFSTRSPSYFDEIPEAVRKKKSFRRFEHYFRQRANADGTVPIETFIAERDAQINKEKSQRLNSNVNWKAIGPNGIKMFFPSQWERNSGRVRALAVHPTNPDIAYIGASAGGIWKTTDGGGSWLDIGSGLSSLSFGAIAIDQTNPNILYAGAGEFTRYFNNNIYDGRGLYKSTDGGKTWTENNVFGSLTHFSAIRISPNNPNIIFATLGSGNLYQQSPGNEGVWRSTDAGSTWARTLVLDNASDVLPSPATGSTRIFAGGAGGVSISTDNGITWSLSNSGLPSDVGRVQLAISQSSPSKIYAAVYRDNTGSVVLYQSTNDGITWTQKYVTPIQGQGWYDLLLGVNPQNSDEVYFGDQQLYRSLDGGNTVNLVGGEVWNQAMHVDFHIMAFSPSDPFVRYVGSDGGIHRSDDDGQTWQELNSLPTLQFYRMASHPTDSLSMIGGSQDNGNYRTTDGGVTWEQTTTGDGMDCFYDYNNPNRVYASVYNAIVFRSQSGGVFGSYSQINTGLSGSAAWVAPYFQDAVNSNTMYVATDRLWRSTQGGDNWVSISNSFGGASTSVSQSPVRSNNFIAVASETGPTSTVNISTDGGISFNSRSVPGNATYIAKVYCHPSEPNTMFVVKTGFSQNNKLYKTTDFGSSWINLSNNLPNIPQSDIFVDPLFPNQIYVANDFGVYRSQDSGASWAREGNGMPIVPALHFSYFNIGSVRKLRIATHGRSAYETPLQTRAFSSNVTSANFSSTELGFYGRDTITVTMSNFGSTPVTINNINNLSSSFFKSVATLPITLQQNQSISVQVWFKPAISGNINDTLIINSNNSEAPQIKVALSGRGIVISPANAGWLYAIGSSPQNQLYRVNEVTGSTTPLFVPNITTQLGGFSIQVKRREFYGFLSISPYTLQRFSATQAEDVLQSIDIKVNQLRSISFSPLDTANLYALSSVGIGGTARARITKVNLSSGDTATVSTTASVGLAYGLTFSPNGSAWISTRAGSENRLYKVNLTSGDATQVYSTTGDVWSSLTFNPSGSRIFVLTGSGTQTNRMIRIDTSGILLADVDMNISGLRTLAVRLDSTGVLSFPQTDLNTKAPTRFTLTQNYPNPFNPSTTISYQLPTTSLVSLDVFDVLGRKVVTLVNTNQPAGEYSVMFDAARLSSGVYFYKLQAGSFVSTRKMMLVK